MSDLYILSREWRVIVDQEVGIQTDCHGRPNSTTFQAGVTELLIMRARHYGRVCFKSVKTLAALYS